MNMRIFEFIDYKAYTRHFISTQPKNGRGLIKAIGEHLGVDPSQISQILSGTKEFTEEQAILTAKFIGLNELETDYFLHLVKIDRAGHHVLADYYRKKRDQLKSESMNLSQHVQQDRILTDFEKATFYSSYLFSAVRLSTSIAGEQTVSDVSERFNIPLDRAASILNFLCATNLCQEENGRFTLGTQHTHIDRASPLVGRHHTNWLLKAIEKTNSLSEEELQFTGPVSLSREDFRSIRETLVNVISSSLKKVKNSEPEEVAVLLIDWFWLNQ